MLKGQLRTASIKDDYHNPLRLGRIQSIQIDSSGALYVFLTNYDLIQIDTDSAKKWYYHYGYGFATVTHDFVINNDELLFFNHKDLDAYNIRGELLYEKKGHFHVTGGVREIKIGEVLYKVQRTGLFDTVWVITLNQKTCVYRRLAWDIPTQMLLSIVILFSCIIPLGKEANRRLAVRGRIF